VRSTLLVLGALVALLLPQGWGLLAVLAAAWAGAERRELLGLALLGASGPLGAWRTEHVARAAPPVAGAFRVDGTWREPPGGPAHLGTPAGPLDARLDAGLLPPPPGTSVRALVRGASPGEARIVALAVLGPPAGAWLDRWAASAAERVRRVVPRARQGLVSALVLGRRDGLSAPLVRACVASGTMHLLALSGLHVALLAGLLGSALGRRAVWATALALAGFVALAGSRPPLVRAALGWALVRLASARGRNAPAWHRLLTVALLMELTMPGLHRELSAQLSFLAVGGLLGAVRLVRGPLAVFAGGAGACLATAPLCVEVFGRVSFLGVLVTPLLVPAVAVILGAGFVAIVAGSTFAALDRVTGFVLGECVRLMEGALGAIETLAPAPLHPNPLPVPGWAASLAVVVALALISAWRAPEARLSRHIA
jgi:ComEC/Rec2-related protein